MPGPCTEKCQLAEDAAVIMSDMAEVKVSHNDTQKIVNGMAVEFGKMSQKLDSYMERGKDEHVALFERTSELKDGLGFVNVALEGKADKDKVLTWRVAAFIGTVLTLMFAGISLGIKIMEIGG